MSTSRAEQWSLLRQRSRSGVFTRAAALEAGYSRDAVRHRIRSGQWVRLAGDGYCAAGDAPGEGAPDRGYRLGVAAGLTWPDGVVAYRSAAVLHRLPVALGPVTHVILPVRRANRPGLLAHYVPLEASEVMRFGGFRATGRPRTILDCLARLPRSEAEQLLAWVRTRELLAVEELKVATAARKGRWGVRQLRELLDMAGTGALGTGELRLQQLLRAGNLRGWEGDQRIVVGGRVVARADVLFRRARLIVELDGLMFHEDFQRDRDRLNRLMLAGYTVLRFTWADVADRPQHVVALVRETLGRISEQDR